MENNTAENIEKRLAELPEDVRNAVLAVEWEEKVRTIANKHSLHIDQTGALGDTTLMAMLGFFTMDEYPERIAQELTIPVDTASTIAAEVNAEVFLPIRDSLRKFTETAVKPTEPAPVVPSAVRTPKPDLSAAEDMLQAKTVTIPALPAIQQETPKPAAYNADPYREPPV